MITTLIDHWQCSKRSSSCGRSPVDYADGTGCASSVVARRGARYLQYPKTPAVRESVGKVRKERTFAVVGLSSRPLDKNTSVEDWLAC